MPDKSRLGCSLGSGGGYGIAVGLSASGSSFARMLLSRFARGDSGYRSLSIAARTRRTTSAYSSGARSGGGIDLNMASNRDKGESERLTMGELRFLRKDGQSVE